MINGMNTTTTKLIIRIVRYSVDAFAPVSWDGGTNEITSAKTDMISPTTAISSLTGFFFEISKALGRSLCFLASLIYARKKIM